MLVSYGTFCFASGALVRWLQIPDALLILLVAPILWAAFFYPLWTCLIEVVILTATALWVTHYTSADPVASHWMIAVTALAVIALIAFVRRQVRYQQALEETKEHYRIIADHAFDLEFWRTPDETFTYISPSCRRITGYSAEEFMQNPQLFAEITHPEDRQTVLKAWENLKGDDETTLTLEFRILNADGIIRWIEYSCHKVFNQAGEYLGVRGSSRDITSRRQTEEALQISNERLRLALQGTKDAVWDINLKSQEKYYSSEYERMLGGPIERPLNIRDMFQFIHPDDRQGVAKAHQAHLESKTQTYHAEYRLKTAEGGWKWVMERGRIIQRDKDGGPLRMVGTIMDVSEHKAMEEALLQSEEMFRQLAENINEVFWLIDHKTRKFIYLSPAFSQIWGREREGLNNDGSAIIDYIHPDDRRRWIAAQDELWETGKVLNEEYRIQRAEGDIRWVRTRGYPIFDANGQYYRVAGISEDITNQKKAEIAHYESEKKYKELIEYQGEGVGMIDPHETFVYVNPAGEAIFGVAHGMLIGRNLKEFIDEEQRPKVAKQTYFRAQGAESSYELVIRRPDETKKNLLVTATPRFDLNGQHLGSVVIFRDITQRKKNEDKLRYISTHDTLTGLYNRAFFEEQITHLEQSNLFPVSVIIIDVDRLKSVNDQYGHSQGDELLIRVSNVLKQSFRSNDVVARIGGDEFAILMPNTDQKTLYQALKRLYDNLAIQNNAYHMHSGIGLSAGGVTCSERGSLREAINMADSRMYKSKEEKKLGGPADETSARL